MKKQPLKEMLKKIHGGHLLSEGDGHPNLVKKNKEVFHNWATHMEWKSSADKNKYGDVIGEVIHHTLLEDGSTPSYDVKFGTKTIKGIPASKLIVVKEQGHSHEADEDPTDNEEKDD